MPTGFGPKEEDSSLPLEGTAGFSLLSAIARGKSLHPNKPMVIDPDGTMTYEEGYRWTCGAMNCIRRSLAVEAGANVLVFMKNRVQFPSLMAALESLGLRAATLPASSAEDDIDRSLTLLGSRLFITDNVAICSYVMQVHPNVQCATVGCTCEGAPCLDHETGAFSEKIDDAEGHAVNATLSLFSSGSTGRPKAIVNRMLSFKVNAMHLADALHMTSEDVLYAPVPFSHVYGMLGIEAAVQLGCTLVSLEKYTPRSSLSIASKSHITVYFGVATMYMRELKAYEEHPVDMSSLRVGLVAGASCPPASFKRFEKVFGCRLTQSYGMTETTATLTVCDLAEPDDVRSRSVGRPVGDNKVALDPTTGEILCKTPCLAIGIITDEGMQPLSRDAKGWFHSGDVGRFDAEGRLYIVGRIKDMIIRGGVNVFPAEIESFYQSYENVVECSVVGYPDDELGERTCLCAVLSKGTKASPKEMRDFAKGKMDRFKIPDTVLMMDSLPHLPNGKIDKRRLKVEAASEIANRPSAHKQG